MHSAGWKKERALPPTLPIQLISQTSGPTDNLADRPPLQLEVSASSQILSSEEYPEPDDSLERNSSKRVGDE